MSDLRKCTKYDFTFSPEMLKFQQLLCFDPRAQFFLDRTIFLTVNSLAKLMKDEDKMFQNYCNRSMT